MQNHGRGIDINLDGTAISSAIFLIQHTSDRDGEEEAIELLVFDRLVILGEIVGYLNCFAVWQQAARCGGAEFIPTGESSSNCVGIYYLNDHSGSEV